MKKHFILSAIFINILILNSISWAQDTIFPSFDCAQSTSITDRIICSTPYLSYLDNRMAIYFKKAQANSPSSKQQELTKEQNDWLNNRASCKGNQGCLITLYKKRNWELYKRAIKSDNSDYLVFVTNGMEFGDFTAIGPLTKNNIVQLGAASINGNGQFINGLPSEFNDNNISNCNEYWKYGLDPDNTSERSVSSGFQNLCGALEEFKRVRAPLLVPIIKALLIDDIKKLPPTFLPSSSNEQESILRTYTMQGLSINDLIKKGVVKLYKKTDYDIILAFDGMEKTVSEIARGNFRKDDGADEIFVIYSQSDGKTSRNYNSCVIIHNKNNVSCE